jgi:hypothetical protein
LKIHLAFLQSLRPHNIPSYQFWEHYIKNGIEEAGFEWVESKVDWAEALTYLETSSELIEWKKRTWKIVLDDIKAQKPAIFLSYFYPQHIDEESIYFIQKMGIKCVNFFCDNVRQFISPPNEFRIFDLNWVPEFEAVSFYQKSGLPTIHLPMPMWVEPRFRNLPEHENSDISFIGSADVQRWKFLETLVQHNLPINIYGAAWIESSYSPKKVSSKKNVWQNQVNFIAENGIQAWIRKIHQRDLKISYTEALKNRIKGKPDFDEYVQITRESMVTLGINRFPSFRFPFDSPHKYSRLRDIEAPMLGACYLSELCPGLDKLYDLESDIYAYANSRECIEKLKFLTENYDLRKKLRINGQKRALQSHSIPQSLNQIKQIFSIK